MKSKERKMVKEMLAMGAPTEFFRGRYTPREIKRAEAMLSDKQKEQRVIAVKSAISKVMSERLTGGTNG